MHARPAAHLVVRSGGEPAVGNRRPARAVLCRWPSRSSPCASWPSSPPAPPPSPPAPPRRRPWSSTW